MQAGIVSRQLTFRMVFMDAAGFTFPIFILVDVRCQIDVEPELRMAA